MDYERKDSMAKAKSGKEPQVLHPTLSAGKPSKLQSNEQKRMKRKEALLKAMDKIVGADSK